MFGESCDRSSLGQKSVGTAQSGLDETLAQSGCRRAIAHVARIRRIGQRFGVERGAAGTDGAINDWCNTHEHHERLSLP